MSSATEIASSASGRASSEWMTARNAVALSGRARGADLGPAGDRLAERFGLDPTVPVRRMSRGMRQKVGIILSLAHAPRLLVLDEPTSGLDPLMRDELATALDVLPTFAKLAGAELPDDRVIDGRDVMADVDAEREKMRDLAVALEAGELRGHTGKPITDLSLLQEFKETVTPFRRIF